MSKEPVCWCCHRTVTRRYGMNLPVLTPPMFWCRRWWCRLLSWLKVLRPTPPIVRRATEQGGADHASA